MSHEMGPEIVSWGCLGSQEVEQRGHGHAGSQQTARRPIPIHHGSRRGAGQEQSRPCGFNAETSSGLYSCARGFNPREARGRVSGFGIRE